MIKKTDKRFQGPGFLQAAVGATGFNKTTLLFLISLGR